MVLAEYATSWEDSAVTSYQTTTFYVEDSNSDSAAFTPLTDNSEHALKMWRTAYLPDGQPVEVNVLFTDDDVRGLQALLNDQFGRGRAAEEPQTAAEWAQQDPPEVEALKQQYATVYGLPSDTVAAQPAGLQMPDYSNVTVR